MFFKILLLTSVLLVCEGNIPDSPYVRRAPFRFLLNNQDIRAPLTRWSYQFVNGRPVANPQPNPNSYVIFGVNPQTGEVEQTQVVAETKPGGPIISLIQNLSDVTGKFVGQLTGAIGNVVGGVLQGAGQLGQDIRDFTNPVTSVTGVVIPHPEPVKEPAPPAPAPSVRIPTVQTPLVPANAVPPPPPMPALPNQPKSDFQEAKRLIDQASISFQILRASLEANFQAFFEGEGQKALSEITKYINEALGELQNIRETVDEEANAGLQAAQTVINTTFDNVEEALVGVTGDKGKEFIEPTRNELNNTFNNAIELGKTF